MTSGQAPPTFAVILAAGTSSRFDQGPKLNAEYQGRALLRRACDAVVASRVDEAIVVLGGDADLLRHHCTATGLETIENPDHALGQSTSLQCGLKAVPASAQGCLFVAADQPLLSAEHINQVLDLATSSDSIVQATADPGSKGTPVYFPRRYFAQLRATRGDEGGRQVLRSLPTQEVLSATVPADALLDIDRGSDLKELSSR